LLIYNITLALPKAESNMNSAVDLRKVLENFWCGNSEHLELSEKHASGMSCSQFHTHDVWRTICRKMWRGTL